MHQDIRGIRPIRCPKGDSNIKGISINFSNIENEEDFRRFVIELSPKLREVGITTCVVLNKNIQENDYINIPCDVYHASKYAYHKVDNIMIEDHDTFSVMIHEDC